MASILRIYVNSIQDTQADWVIMNADGSVKTVVLSGDPSLLSTLNGEKEIQIIIPGDDVTISTVKLPPMNAHKRKEAIPYALEDQFIPEVEQLHFTLVNTDDDETTTAVIARERLNQWLALFTSWGIQPDGIFPLSLCLPGNTQECSLLWHHTYFIARIYPFVGFCCDADQATHYVQSMLLNYHPDKIILWQTNAEKLTLDLVPNVEKQFIAWQEFLPTLIPPADANLLTAEFATKKSFFKESRIRNWLSITLAGWLLLLISYPLISYAFLHHETRDLQQQMVQIYHRHFPNATAMIVPKKRLEEKLAQHGNVTDGQTFLNLLSKLALALKQNNGIELQKLIFQQTQLSIDLSANSSNALSSLISAIENQGLTAKQQQTTFADNQVKATLRIE